MKRIEVFISEGNADRRLGTLDANLQMERIRSAVAHWRDVAVRLGISRREQEEMSVCFARG